MFLAINITLSMGLIFLTHPLSVTLFLLGQTLLTSLMCNIMSSSAWFSYILFLIMVSSMLIIFIYMTSIASNEKFMMSPLLLVMMALILLTSLLYLYVLHNNLLFAPNSITSYSHINSLQYNTMLTKYFNFPMLIIVSMMIIYLLLALIATVKITDFKHGPIRHMS
uniref:NADH dehydrogenase subunit 6 n=1 Tax=Tenebrionoidea sp. 20 KM-2017 TaxID=2219476 RepID=A0A346RIM1_9CUCU|nr:NADH dehydrogenase subunit 6 [Tenebrionoidea sp. 20 KM-2017]